MIRTLSFILVLCALVAFAATAGAYETDAPVVKARVEFDSMSEFEAFMRTPGLDIMQVKKGVGVTFATDPETIAWIESSGYDIVVEMDDMQAFYSRRMRGDNFGEFHTYSETVDFLDDLRANYPSIVSEKFSIATTFEGNDVWGIKVSDNHEVDESEPEIVFDALHHAREPITIEVMMHYLEWLTENYGTDPDATYLVDNREMYFFPVINPDGYLYNEIMSPTGGGMWRKNRYDHPGSSCYGVDPNRNYDTHFGEVGSDPGDPCSDVHCGPYAHSEPEVDGYASFVLGRDFRFNLSLHSTVGCILIPWGYTPSIQTPDNDLLMDIGNEMAKYNGYDVGQAGDILWYSCSGTTTDWMYEDANMLAMCIEVDGSDFWMLESEIPGLRAENLWPQIYATRMVGPYLSVEDLTFSGGDGDQEPEEGETLDLTLTARNDGIYDSVNDVTATLLTSDAYLQLLNAQSSFGNLAARASADNSSSPLSFSIASSVPAAHTLTLTMVLEGDGFYAEEDFSWLVGEPVVLFEDDMESGSGNWVENDGYWGLSTMNFHSPDNAYTDSPIGNYASYRNTWIELASSVDLAHANQAVLSFWHRVMTEENYDYCYVEASPDGGATWYQLGSRYHGNVSWTLEELTIPGEYCTSDFRMRFRLQSDAYIVDDGWFVDDVRILGPAPGNVAPTEPTLSSPPDGGTVSTPTPDLVVTNSSDPDPDVLTYAFSVYSDELRTNEVSSATSVAEGSGTTSWTVAASLAAGDYWWTAYADDGTERSPLMETGTFTVDSSGVEDGLLRLALHSPSPNPFRAETKLSFTLPSSQDVELSVYSVDGRLVRRLVSGAAVAGSNSALWDGTDESGRRVGSGLYFVRLEADAGSRYGKLILLK